MTETYTHPDANDVLMGGGGYPAIKFDTMRVWKGGTIVAKPTTRQETEFGTGKPKTYPKSGDPIYGLLVDVQTDERTDAEDDGIRRMYIEGKRLKDAVREGVTASGAPGLATGGKLFVAWVGEEQGQGATPAKVYEARYYPPVTPVPVAQNGSAGAREPMPEPGAQGNYSGTVSALVPPATSQPPAQAPMSPPPVSPPAPAAPMPEPGAQSPAPAPTGNNAQDPTPEAIAALRAAGLDPQTVFPNYHG
jgi:hypothetical protein